MDKEAYSDWVDLFDDDVSKVWSQEGKELQKTAMLFTALQKELEKVQNNVSEEILNLRRTLVTRDELKEKVNTIPSCLGNENIEDRKPKEDCAVRITNDYSGLESPDLFTDIVHFQPFRQLSPIYGQDKVLHEEFVSPKLESKKFTKRRKSDPQKENSATKDLYTIKKDIFNAPNSDDETVINCTPELSCRLLSRKANNPINRKIRKKTRNTTLTQIFSRSNMSDNYANQNNDTSNEMAITDILLNINRDSEEENCSYNDSTSSINAFSKGGFLDSSDADSPKVSKVVPALRPITIGNDLQAVGFSCNYCKSFYPNLKYSPEELEKNMKDCCKRHYRNNQYEETPAGFWDLTFASQVEIAKK